MTHIESYAAFLKKIVPLTKKMSIVCDASNGPAGQIIPTVFKDTPVTGRLIDTGGFQKKNRITHRIPIASLTDIDDEVKHWLQTAYEWDA